MIQARYLDFDSVIAKTDLQHAECHILGKAEYSDNATLKDLVAREMKAEFRLGYRDQLFFALANYSISALVVGAIILCSIFNWLILDIALVALLLASISVFSGTAFAIAYIRDARCFKRGPVVYYFPELAICDVEHLSQPYIDFDRKSYDLNTAGTYVIVCPTGLQPLIASKTTINV